MKCVIIDDEPKAIEVLQRYVDKVPGLEMLSAFDRPVEALAFLKDHQPDCLFLDINMPDLDGLQLSRLVQHIPVIFTTAYPQFALDSYEVNAIDYLLKPIALSRFLKAVEKVRAAIKASQPDAPPIDNSGIIFIKSGTKTFRVLIEDIIYLETLGNYIVFYTPTLRISSRLTVNGLFDILPKHKFVRLHKSFIVSKNSILVVESHQVTTKSGTRLPIGPSYRNELKAALTPGSGEPPLDQNF